MTDEEKLEWARTYLRRMLNEGYEWSDIILWTSWNTIVSRNRLV